MRAPPLVLSLSVVWPAALLACGRDDAAAIDDAGAPTAPAKADASAEAAEEPAAEDAAAGPACPAGTSLRAARKDCASPPLAAPRRATWSRWAA